MFQCEPVAVEEDGWSEWLHPLPGFLAQCCDCGLIHEMEFRLVETDRIIFRARRHDDNETE